MFALWKYEIQVHQILSLPMKFRKTLLSGLPSNQVRIVLKFMRRYYRLAQLEIFQNII